MTGKKATRSPYLFGSGTITAMFHTQQNPLCDERQAGYGCVWFLSRRRFLDKTRDHLAGSFIFNAIGKDEKTCHTKICAIGFKR
jgi:hypothetical protein